MARSTDINSFCFKKFVLVTSPYPLQVTRTTLSSANFSANKPPERTNFHRIGRTSTASQHSSTQFVSPPNPTSYVRSLPSSRGSTTLQQLIIPNTPSLPLFSSPSTRHVHPPKLPRYSRSGLPRRHSRLLHAISPNPCCRLFRPSPSLLCLPHNMCYVRCHRLHLPENRWQWTDFTMGYCQELQICDVVYYRHNVYH